MAAMERTGIFELAVQGGCGVLREMQRLLSEAKTQEERDSLVNAVSSYQDFKQVSALWVACHLGHVDVVKWLVRQGAAVDHKELDAGWTPSHAAAAGGHSMVLETLGSHNANMSSLDDSARTPLHVAAEWGR